MSLNDFIDQDWVPAPVKPAHPHPLRSHSTENLHQDDNINSDRPDSSVLSPAVVSAHYQHRRSRSVHSLDRFTIHSINSLSAVPPGLPSASTERLSDLAVSSKDVNNFPVVAVRPPLRPTISFGGETRISYYSITSNDLEQKSKAVAVEEELQHRRDQLRKDPAKGGWRTYALLTSRALVSLCNGMSTTSMATILPAVAHDLNSTAVQAFWIASSFLLSSALTQPLIMQMSGALNGRVLLILGVLLFTAGSITSALAATTAGVMAGRILQGCGAGTILAMSHIIDRAQHLSSRGTCERTVASVYWLGCAVGPILAASISRTNSWHNIFWLNALIGMIGGIPLVFLAQSPASHNLQRNGLQKVDFLGWAILAGSIVSLLTSFSWAGLQYTWTSGQTLGPLLVGVAGLVAWTQYSRFSLEPSLPISLLRSASVVVSCFGSIVHGMIFTSIIFVMPLILQSTGKATPALASLALAPWTFSNALMCSLAGFIVGRHGYRWSIWAGCACVVTGSSLMVLLTSDKPMWICIPIGITTGTGLGLLAPALGAAIGASSTNTAVSIHAQSLHSFCSTLGQALGITIASCILLNQLHDNDASVLDVISPRSTAVHIVWTLFAAFAGLAFVLSIWFTEDSSALRRSSRRSDDQEMATSV